MVVLSQKTLVVYVQKSEERRRGCNSRNTKKSRSNSQKLAWIKKKWGLERRSYGFCYQLKLGKHFKTAQQQQMFFKNILENSINYVVCILSHVFRSIASKTSMHSAHHCLLFESHSTGAHSCPLDYMTIILCRTLASIYPHYSYYHCPQ